MYATCASSLLRHLIVTGGLDVSVYAHTNVFPSKTNHMHNISNVFYFDNSNLHVSDGLSVHHQESKTVHTA